jgi:hypothetical protein
MRIGVNPTLDRRANIIARLEEQKLLLNDPSYIRTVRTWVKKDGQLTPVDKHQRVLPWWRVNEHGSYVFFVRVGSKLIEFENGKNAVAVPSLDKMPLVINILITAGAQRRTGPAISANEETRCAEVPQDRLKRGRTVILMKKKFKTDNRTI